MYYGWYTHHSNATLSKLVNNFLHGNINCQTKGGLELTDSTSSQIHLAIRDLRDTMVFKFESLRDELREVKNTVAELNQSVADLQAAVAGVADRVNQLVGPLQDQISELETTIANERQAAADLAAAEDAEDVAQNQALADAQAATDQALANAQSAADSIEVEVGKLNDVAPATPPADGGEPGA